MSDDCRSCNEYLALSRRQFLGVSGAGALALAAPEWLPRVAYAQDACIDRDILICVFLRGAMDGLTACVPHADDLYYAARPTLAIPRPDSGDPNRAIDLNGYFGFPQMLAPLIPAYQAGHLLIVHACGSNSGTRSHFDAMRFMEIAKPGDNTLFTGWLGRHLATSPPMSPSSILRAIGIGYGLQQSLQGGPQGLPVPDLANFNLTGDSSTLASRMATIVNMYAATTDPLKSSALNIQQTINFLGAIDFAGYQPAGGAVYPDEPFAYAMKSTAALIKADVGVETVAIDIPGWDTHGQQGVAPGGALWKLLTSLANGLAPFHDDIFAGNGRNITVMVMSEFGRRLLENGSLGTDHGHGNCMFIMGNHIAGGRILTQWPGLASNQLFQGRDLAVTIDFRDLMAEVVFHRLKNPNLATIFPGYTPTFRGVTVGCSGDLNCDSLVTADDVAPFANALLDPSGFQPTACGATADMNGDGRVDGLDIQQFIRSVLQ